jgi:hypothetical protein
MTAMQSWDETEGITEPGDFFMGVARECPVYGPQVLFARNIFCSAPEQNAAAVFTRVGFALPLPLEF